VVVIAHLSDLHIDVAESGAESRTQSGETRSVGRARAVMDYLDGLAYDLDLVLVTGDIADHGTPAEYVQARQLLASRHPVLACPGNHDDRAAFRRHLLREPALRTPLNQVLRAERYVIAVCDSSVPGKGEGHLDAETMDWLEEVVARTPGDTPVLVAFHHPPAVLHVPFIDGIRQFGTDRLATLARRHPNIAAFLCGHAHTAAATTFADRPLLVAPGVVSTLRLPWEPRSHPEDHVDLDQPPALAFHVLDDGGRLTTHFRSVAAGPSAQHQSEGQA
jgi:Icc protein